MSSTPEQLPDSPREVPISEARAMIGELADAAAAGKVIYLTRRGQRVAALVPADEKLATDPVGLAIARDFIAANKELFDRLADA
jgi:prevent-host-death family protein